MRMIGGVFVSILLAVAGVHASDTPLADAAKNNDLDRVRTLMTEGADVNAAQGDGMTALHWAAFHDNDEVADLLLAADADVSVQTRVGALTPLWFAATNGNADMVDWLLTTEADANVVTATGATALMAAAMTGSVETIDVLVERGAFVNSRETLGNPLATPHAK